MPAPLDQYRAVRQGAGVFDRSSRGRIALRGADRLTFLHALLTNDIAGLTGGRGCYAALLTPQGRMIADMRVFELGDTVLLDVHRASKDVLLAKLDQMLFSEDVQLGDVSDSFGCISVQGPLAAGIAGPIAGADPASCAAWAPYENRRAEWRGESVIVARVDETAVAPGFFLFAPMPAVPALAAAVGGAGAIPADPEVAEILRVEAGIPEFFVDMNDETIPLEAGLEATAISYAKGCFPGQEVLVRIRDRGHGRVARRLVGLSIEGDTVPAGRAAVLHDGKDAGEVTSAVWSPALGRPIALAYVRRDVADAGGALTVAIAGGVVPAAVTALPFERPDAGR